MPVAPLAVEPATDTSERLTSRAACPPARPARPHGDRQFRLAGLVTRVLRGGYLDPLFARPDLIEDDYYRFQHQPRG